MKRRSRTSARRRENRLQQLEFGFVNLGGRRPGAGRKPKGERAGVPHRVRDRMRRNHPMHVTARLLRGLPSLRRSRVYRVLRSCFLKGCDRKGFRLVHFSVQSNYLHLLCEAESQERMVRGLQGLFVRIAKALNRLWSRRGSVFADRYHDHVLRTPLEVRNALSYILNNARRHRCVLDGLLDQFASGWWFDGWREDLRFAGMEPGPVPITPAKNWLVTKGWRQYHGRIPVAEVPGPG